MGGTAELGLVFKKKKSRKSTHTTTLASHVVFITLLSYILNPVMSINNLLIIQETI